MTFKKLDSKTTSTNKKISTANKLEVLEILI